MCVANSTATANKLPYQLPRTITRSGPREAARPAALQVEEVHHRIGIRRDIMRYTPCLVRLELVAIPKPRPSFERNVLRNLRRFLAHIKHARPLFDLLTEVLWIKYRVCCAMECLELRSKAAIRGICVAHNSCPLRSVLDDLASSTRVTPDVEAVASKTAEGYTGPRASCCEYIRITTNKDWGGTESACVLHAFHAVPTYRWSSSRLNLFR